MSTPSFNPSGAPHAASPNGTAPVNPAVQGYAASPYGVPAPAPMALPAMPGRGLAVSTLVIGILLMVLIAPSVFFGMLISSAASTSGNYVEGGTKDNGSLVTVTADGHYMVQAPGSTDPFCSLIDSDTKRYQLQRYDGQDGVYMASGVPAGQYTLRCDGISANASIIGYNASPDVVTKTFFTPFLWATGFGVAGVIATIVGIVLLVKVNGKRRRIMREAMMAAVR